MFRILFNPGRKNLFFVCLVVACVANALNIRGPTESPASQIGTRALLKTGVISHPYLPLPATSPQCPHTSVPKVAVVKCQLFVHLREQRFLEIMWTKLTTKSRLQQWKPCPSCSNTCQRYLFQWINNVFGFPDTYQLDTVLSNAYRTITLSNACTTRPSGWIASIIPFFV